MKKHTLKEWFLATRPWSFPASAMPVLVTLAYLFWQQYDVCWWKGLWCVLNIVVFHAAGNTWSDYHDFKSGVDNSETAGGTAITSGQFEPGEIRGLSMALLVVAVVSGISIVICTGLPVLYLGLAGFFLTLLYPFLKYRALGDVDIFLTYSLLPILGTSFVSTGEIHYGALWLSVPIGLITVAILHINNLRDMEYDKKAGISTFAMRIGAKWAVAVYGIELLLPFVWIVACALCGVFPWWSVLALIAVAPAAANVKKSMRYEEGGMSAVIGLDEQTAKLQLLFGMLLFISFLVPVIF
ncbi:MAG: prenyltransferase [Bacteroidales bacterium]|nr:prenyltransferase [Bacteroidales bacterium]